MKQRVLIVEDQFIEANNLQLILEKAGYHVCSIARSVPVAIKIIEKENPDLVLLDIYLQGPLTGIDLAKTLREKDIAFVYLSANSNKDILETAKATKPYGFLVKPFRAKDVLVTLDVAQYLHQHRHDTSLASSPKTISLAAAANQCAGIIGESQQWMEVMEYARIVAPTETSVLLLGESGTGKERVADCIHALSSRSNKPFIKVNCAALPASLIESELFGHEKGSFTGAVEKRIGKFEQADGGTVLLDEIGEMPFEIQVKLLRVLQEREIERIGGRSPIKLDVRVIAATNRILEKEIAEGRFRIDLYYRLNVFPIHLPSLRDRKEDIPLLAYHFIDQFSQKTGKKIVGLSDESFEQLLNYNWPGNIRELEHLIERSVLLAKGNTIREIPLPGNNTIQTSGISAEIKTIDQNEREHILAVLRKCKGKIFGPGGAAELLGIKVSTLNSRIKKLGIKKENIFE
ncbi:MAG TPA: sigma-54 dependent transcriptional regulator [Chitinophagaceae bacterium]|jgi:DNA-binding NtrC family response regulator|nr:sigma-54 dependent transcriptional regulator [Chitinophagaceae bacterium]